MAEERRRDAVDREIVRPNRVLQNWTISLQEILLVFEATRLVVLALGLPPREEEEMADLSPLAGARGFCRAGGCDSVMKTAIFRRWDSVNET